MGRMANNRASKLVNNIPDSKIIASIRTGKQLPNGNLTGAQSAAATVVNSAWWKTELVRSGVPEDKIKVIPNGIVHPMNTVNYTEERKQIRNHYKANDDTIVFLCVAEFRAAKRQEQLIEYFTRLPEHLPAQLWLVGEGEQLNHCQSIADRMNSMGRIKFPGFKNNPLPYYAGADIAVSASVEDASPNFLAEAQYAGLPVIAVDYRGVKECFVDGESGMLITGNGKATFQEAMQTLGSDRAVREKMSAHAKTFAVEKFDAVKSAEAHLELFAAIG